MTFEECVLSFLQYCELERALSRNTLVFQQMGALEKLIRVQSGTQLKMAVQ